MKFFIDTANLDQIKEAQELGVLDGVTTNPSLMAKEGITGQQNILDHYVKIYTENCFYLKKTSLTQLASKINSNEFSRIHRSYIVNKSAVQKVVKSKGTVTLLMPNDVILPVGKTFQGKDQALTFTSI